MSLFAHNGGGTFNAAADSARVLTLAQRFSSEPELILACLDPDAETVSPGTGMVLAAALAAVEQRPSYADLKYFAAEAAIRAGRLELAAELLEAALRLNPRYNAALIAAGRVCFLRDDMEGALNYLQQALSNGADYPDVHLLLGDIWRARGDMARAGAAYMQALERNSGLAAARERLKELGGGQSLTRAQ